MKQTVQAAQIKTPKYSFKRDIVKVIAILVFFLVPFISISGAPLLRFDLHALVIYIFGQTVTTAQIFPLLLFIFSFVFLFIFFTQLLGRIWCAWLCPQTILLECLPGRGNLNQRLSAARKVLMAAIAAFVSIFFTFGLILYTTSFEHFLRMLTHGNIHFLWWILAGIIFLNLLFIGRRFCRTVCPYSMFQSVMYDADTLRVAFDTDRADECIHCNACVHVCPTELDIREGLSNKCICCASCVDACGKVMAKLGKHTLVDYFFGQKMFRPFRANRLITLGLSIFFLIAALFTFNSSLGVRIKVEDINNGNIHIKMKNTHSNAVYMTFYYNDEEVKRIELSAKGREDAYIQMDEGVHGYMEVHVVEGRKSYTQRLDLRSEDRDH